MYFLNLRVKGLNITWPISHGCFRLSFADLDPCLNVKCYYYAICKALGEQSAECVCPKECPEYEAPVCASNGVTYRNLCEYKKAICAVSGNFTIVQNGSCKGTTIVCKLEAQRSKVTGELASTVTFYLENSSSNDEESAMLLCHCLSFDMLANIVNVSNICFKFKTIHLVSHSVFVVDLLLFACSPFSLRSAPWSRGSPTCADWRAVPNGRFQSPGLHCRRGRSCPALHQLL